MVKLFPSSVFGFAVERNHGSVSIAVVLYFGGALILEGNSSFDGAFFVTFLIIFSQLIPLLNLSRKGFSN